MFSQNEKMSMTVNGDYIIRLKKCEELDKLYKRNPEHLVNMTIAKAKDKKTDQQMKALRALIGAFFYSGMSSCPVYIDDLDKFTVWIKLQIEYSVVMDFKGQEIPIPKSFADASKDEMIDCIDRVLKLIYFVEAHSDKKIAEIIQGMQENSLY